jgi:membrane protein
VNIKERIRAVDRFQQSHRPLAFAVGVVKKFGDDEAGSLAALIAYYAFVSIFPLLLVFVSILGFVIHGNPAEQKKVVDGTLGQIPMLGDPLKKGASLSGSGPALAIGVVLTLLSGMGVTNAAQNAFNRVWSVPKKARPNWVKTRLRGLGLLAVLGSLNVMSTAAAGFTTSSAHGVLVDVAGVLVALLFNLLLFFAAFRLLTAADVATRDLLPGVIAAAILWQSVQHLGGYWANKVKHQEALYGQFGLTLGLLAFLYVGAQLTIFAAEINAVRARRLWPRSLLAPPNTEADRRALTAAAEVEERVAPQRVHVSFDKDPEPNAGEDSDTNPTGSAAGSFRSPTGETRPPPT